VRVQCQEKLKVKKTRKKVNAKAEQLRKTSASEDERRAHGNGAAWKAGSLEDDRDSTVGQIRKRSQEDFVIMEEQEEEEGHENKTSPKYSEVRGNNAEELDDDEVREMHKNAVMKATSLIRNKYRHSITKEQYEQAERQIDSEINAKCKQIFKVEYSKLSEQSNKDLDNMCETIEKINDKDWKKFEQLQKEYENSLTDNEVPQKSSGKDRYSEETANEQASQLKNKMLVQSSELMNLIVNPEKEQNMRTSNDPSAKRKQVFESQNLEQHLASVDDLKKSGVQSTFKNAHPMRESGTNLLKKSIQSDLGEQL